MIWLYIWLAVTAVAVIVEFLTNELVSVWFIGGGVVAAILAGAGLEWYYHVPAFIVVSLVMLLCLRDAAVKRLNRGGSRTNAETVIGKEFELLSDIGFNSPGTIKINDVIWNAVTEDGKNIEKGKKVIILRIEGNKYIVKEK